MFVTVDSINASNLSSVKRHPSGLNIRPATLKTRLFVISNLLTIFFKLRVTMHSALWWPSDRLKCSIAFCRFFIWNEINSDANIDALPCMGSKVNGQQKFAGFFWVFLPVFVDDLCSHASYQRCGKVLSTWVKVPYSCEKKLYKLLYCLYT